MCRPHATFNLANDRKPAGLPRHAEVDRQHQVRVGLWMEKLDIVPLTPHASEHRKIAIAIVRLQSRYDNGAFPSLRSLKPTPGIHDCFVSLHPPFAWPRSDIRFSRTEPGAMILVRCHRSGSRLRSGLCCPDPSTLNRPHPSRWQARSDFPLCAVIRNASAVRERLGRPPVGPCFHSKSLSTCRPL